MTCPCLCAYKFRWRHEIVYANVLEVVVAVQDLQFLKQWCLGFAESSVAQLGSAFGLLRFRRCILEVVRICISS